MDRRVDTLFIVQTMNSTLLSLSLHMNNIREHTDKNHYKKNRYIGQTLESGDAVI